nr:MAG TPA: hypothetical protein [Caudoviricetes sp.]
MPTAAWWLQLQPMARSSAHWQPWFLATVTPHTSQKQTPQPPPQRVRLRVWPLPALSMAPLCWLWACCKVQPLRGAPCAAWLCSRATGYLWAAVSLRPKSWSLRHRLKWKLPSSID